MLLSAIRYLLNAVQSWFVMNILGFDTSTKLLPVVLGDENRILSESCIDSFSRHSSGIIPAIEKTLKNGRVEIEDIDLVAVGLGPGSLTGIRVGMAVAKGLCFSLEKPALGICSLDIIAENIKAENIVICPIVDARRSLLFSAFYKRKNGILQRISAPRIISLDDLLSKVRKPDIIFTGNGLSLYSAEIKKKFCRSVFAEESCWYPRAESLWRRAVALKAKADFHPEDLKPVYLYPKECQVRKVTA